MTAMRSSPLAQACLLAVCLLAPAAWAADQSKALQRAEEIVQSSCFICHGMEGESSTPAFPRLAGQSARYVARQLLDYQTGKRASTAMQPMVQDLTPADFDALGLYFSTRATVAHTVDDPKIAQVGEYIYHQGNADSGLPSCASCHGPAAHGTETLPRLAGQHAKYTENQLRQFNRRQRTNDNAVMHAVASKLTELELKGVAAYISGLN